MRRKAECLFFHTAVKESREAVRERFALDGVLSVPLRYAPPSGSGPKTLHYSFDFAQQIHYPHNPLHLGPMYFKTALKYAVFGI